MATALPARESKSKLAINAISIIVPIVVAVMFGFQNKLSLGDWTKVLPHIIGGINFLTTLFLIAGLIFIKQNKINAHRIAMTSAFTLGFLFLICYVTYHISNPSNKFNGEGVVRYVYFFFLITHIALSIIVLPFVLRSMFFAVTGQFTRHKKLVKYAYPIWLYVSLTGVIVYLLLYQIFPAA